MHVTSHFIGLPVDNQRFADLFVDLQQYFAKNNLQNAIELQNLLSLHITVYYLEAELSTQDKTKILEDISGIAIPTNISSLRTEYFGEPGAERVCYVTSVTQGIQELNTLLAAKYARTAIVDNQYGFVPHISLFRIKQPELFAPHKETVTSLISQHVTSVDSKNLVQPLRLYQVNSLFQPEIQIPIL